MKNRTSFMLVLAALMSAILACSVNLRSNVNTICGSGKVVTEVREVNNISSVELAMTGTLHITVRDKEALTIEGEDNLMGFIQTDVSLGRLVIKTTEGTNLQPTQPIKYDLTVNKLTAIAISSDGDIETDNLSSDSFSIMISSSGGLSINSLDCTALQVKSSSSGEYHANALPSASAEVTISSSGSATIRVSDKLSGSLSSSGNVYYIGNPSVNINTSSSGKAVQINQ